MEWDQIISNVKGQERTNMGVMGLNGAKWD